MTGGHGVRFGACRVALVDITIAACVVGSPRSGAPGATAAGPHPVLRSMAATATDDCENPTPPDTFHDDLVTAIGISKDLPTGWADSEFIPKIVCWQGSNFDVLFDAKGDSYHEWHGLFAMTTEEVETIAGPWMISDKDAFKLSTKCFVWGWVKCPRTTENTRSVQQIIAGLRWIWLEYKYPKGAWPHIVATGRFNSYPRPGTDDTSTTTPFGLCPVAGSVSYWDDFGQPRHVGGYHPHWGNDIFAPRGREIRSPFDGLAHSHTDDWFAGNYVTIVGAKGYVRNAHLDSFGTLGNVTQGTVIGYVGNTGDAQGGATHDHFEWHPWVVPTPLHVAPSGFSRVMDAIDPFPFLNKVCTSVAPATAQAQGASMQWHD